MDKSHDDVLKTTGNNSVQPALNAAPNPTPTSASNISSNSAHPQSASHQSQNPASANPNVAFKSDYIGQWAAKQEDPFAEQNRKAAEKKAAQEAARKKAMPYVKIGSIVAGCVAVIAIIVTVVLVIINQPKPEVPTIAGGTIEDITDYKDKLDEIYEQDKDMSAVEDAIEDAMNTDNGREYANQLKLSQMMFYIGQNIYDEAINIGETVEVDQLELAQQANYYALMAIACASIGDNASAEKYNSAAYEVNLKIYEAEHNS
jgi:hypothetical protein